MNNYKVQLSYNGKEFFGFQRQPSGFRTVEGVLLESLKKIFKQDVFLNVAGRTDRGVHAENQVVNFSSERFIASSSLKDAMNGMLPPDVYVRCVEIADLSFHARKSAKSRQYRYWFANNVRDLPVIYWDFVQQFSYPILFDNLHKFREIFMGTHNFEYFKNEGSSYQNPIKHIFEFELTHVSPAFPGSDHLPVVIYELKLSASGFMYKMVRNIVGSIWEVLRGSRLIGELQGMISRECRFHYTTASSKGLSLVQVSY